MSEEQKAYPFAAIVGQDDLKHALVLSAIEPSIGGVLALGDRGTGKTTAVRALAAALPTMRAVKGCPFSRHPDDAIDMNEIDQATSDEIESIEIPVPVVDLPLGVTQDRLLGSLDIERALVDGSKEFEPGLLADANRGFLYVDEVNLLEDHLVDVLLDVSASGWNVIEREGLSIRHPAKFVLVGSGNPEEGELRPQLLDRFGLSVDVETPMDIKKRVEIIRRRETYEADPIAFVRKWKRETTKIRNRISRAQDAIDIVAVDDKNLSLIAEICINLGTDGLRGELTLIKAARADAAWRGDTSVSAHHIRRMAPLALSHRLRKDPLDESRSSVRVERTLEEIFSSRSAA